MKSLRKIGKVLLPIFLVSVMGSVRSNPGLEGCKAGLEYCFRLKGALRVASTFGEKKIIAQELVAAVIRLAEVEAANVVVDCDQKVNLVK